MINRRTTLLLLLLVGITTYNVYDNHRFMVVEAEIAVERLPQSFDGFRILQISDLHGKYFGEHQADLIRVINSLDYDMIAFTGDMNASRFEVEENVINSSQPILDLLDGIVKKDLMFWVDGNTGPYAMKNDGGLKNGDLTEIGMVLQEKGCIILDRPHAIPRGRDRIWMTPEMNAVIFDWERSMMNDVERLGGTENAQKFASFYRQRFAAFQQLRDNGEVKILLTHVPKQINLTPEEIAQTGELDYSLILAGHFHGGQLRLPLIGALYIPSPMTGWNGSGFFPDPRAVKGWSYFGDTPQYVSTGLGASDHIWLASFRLFNTPEINLITLTQK